MTRLLKCYATLDVHLNKLEQRGMALVPEFASQWLRSVGYYRLSGYWYPFRELSCGGRTDNFAVGTTFRDVVALYEFDRKLRTLVHDGVERVEVMLRAHLNESIGAIGPLAYLDARSFRPTFDHSGWVHTAQRRIDRSRRRNDAVKHHDDHYAGKLPIWVLSEVLDFADVSRLYDGLPASMQWEIAEQVGVRIDLNALSRNQATKARKNHPLARWYEQLAIIRNTCAHHTRLWNGSFLPVGTSAMRTIPELASMPEGQSERLYGGLCLMGLLLEAASPGTSWRGKLRQLVEDSFMPIHGRHVEEMGFPETWFDDPFWSRRPQ